MDISNEIRKELFNSNIPVVFRLHRDDMTALESDYPLPIYVSYFIIKYCI